MFDFMQRGVLRECEYLDGSAHLATANILQKWTSAAGVGSNTTIVASPPPGRVGPALRFTSGGSVSKTLNHRAGWVIGMARYFDNPNFFQFSYVGSHSGQAGGALCQIRHEADSTISITTNGQLVANSAPFALQANAWYYIELDYDLSGTNNISLTASLWVNGALRASGTAPTNVNVANLLIGKATTNFHIFSNASVNAVNYQKDLIIMNKLGATNKSRKGSITFQTVFPASDVSTQWTPSRAGTHFDLVNENPPDDDTTYIQDLTPTDRDNFTFQPLTSFSGGIIAAQHLAYARKTGQGTRSMKLTIGGPPDQLGPEIFLADNYLYYPFPTDVNPTTGTPWTKANFDADTYGVEQVS